MTAVNEVLKEKQARRRMLATELKALDTQIAALKKEVKPAVKSGVKPKVKAKPKAKKN